MEADREEGSLGFTKHRLVPRYILTSPYVNPAFNLGNGHYPHLKDEGTEAPKGAGTSVRSPTRKGWNQDPHPVSSTSCGSSLGVL